MYSMDRSTASHHQAYAARHLKILVIQINLIWILAHTASAQHHPRRADVPSACPVLLLIHALCCPPISTSTAQACQVSTRVQASGQGLGLPLGLRGACGQAG